MSYAIDLDAQRREVQYPNGIPVKFSGEQFVFPAELPADALDPLLSDELGLVALLGEILQAPDGEISVKEITAALFRRPALPHRFLDAVRNTYAILLGDQYQHFASYRPSLGDYVRLTMALARVYGVGLGKLFASGDSSESDGATSNPTSPATTESTPDVSGSAPASPDSSASGA